MTGGRMSRRRARYGVDGPAPLAVLVLATAGLVVGSSTALVASVGSADYCSWAP